MNNFLVHLGHHAEMALVADFWQQDLTVIELECADVFNINTASEQRFHVFRHQQWVITLENLHIVSLFSLMYLANSDSNLLKIVRALLLIR